MILRKDGVNLMETADKTPSAVQVVPDVQIGRAHV